MFILLVWITSKSPTISILLVRITSKINIYNTTSATAAATATEVCVFAFASDSASDFSIQWKFRLLYIDSCQDAKCGTFTSNSY